MKKRSVRPSTATRLRVDTAHRARATHLASVPDKPPLELDQLYQVLVECPDEEAQRALFERLASEGYPCRALVL